MGAGEQASSLNTDWKKKESFKSASLKIVLVGIVLSGIVFGIYLRGSKKKEVGLLLKEAATSFVKGNPRDIEKAMSLANRALEIDDQSPEALSLAAGIATEQWLVHRLEGAETKARDLLKRAENADSKSAERYGTQASILTQEGKAQEADALIEELRKKGANAARIWHALGQAQQAVGNLTLARQAFNAAVEREWKDARFPASYAQLLMSESNFLQAQEALSKGLSINPDHFQSRLLQAWVNTLREERVKDAEDTVKEILSRESEISPGIKALALTVSAEVANYKGEFDNALKAANEALQIDATYPWALFAKARALGLKKDAGALEAFKASTAAAKTTPLFYFEGAKLVQALGNQDGALELINTYEGVFKNVQIATTDGKLASFLDRDDRYWITRGDILKGAQKFDDALASYDKAIAAGNVNLARAHLAKGRLFLEQKKFDKALETLADIAPEDGSGHLPEAYLAMGELFFAQKDWGKGCTYFGFSLTKYRAQNASREKLDFLLGDVQKKLVANNQPGVAKAWVAEAKPLIQ